ncbi:MAG: methyltransferase domain-containing protein [Anaerolineales bacterium]
MIKVFKDLIRKAFFYPFGYDIVPLRRPKVSAPLPSPPPIVKLGSENLEVYRAWFGEEALRERRFYNVGAEAQFSHPAWTRINHPSEHYGSENIDIHMDLMARTRFPVEDGKAKVIFSRYTLEHITDEMVQHFLAEAYRALAEDGFLRLIVPDIDIYYAAYRLKDEAFYYRPKHDLNTFPNENFLSNINEASFEQKFLWNFASSASELHPEGAIRVSDVELRKVLAELSFEEALNYCTAKCSVQTQQRHPENHINWFNASKLGGMVSKAGFTQVYRSGYGQSRCPVLRDTQLLEARQPEVGLFLEAQK